MILLVNLVSRVISVVIGIFIILSSIFFFIILLSVFWWVSGIKYVKNEVYFDFVEEMDVIVNK